MPTEPILIVDDNVSSLKLERVLLQGDGREIRTAGNAEEAREVLKTFQPRLILMDIQMPGMDGLELTRLLKADPATRDALVVALSAYSMEGEAEKALSAGCEGYICKPIDTRTFRSQVEQYLVPRTTPKPAVADGDYHDLLTELRNNFLADGQEESRRLLESLDTRPDVASARRITHRWAGVAGTLGFPQISHKALETETLLEKPIAGIAAPLRARLEDLARLFADGMLGKLDLPVFTAEKDLSGKRFALIGFEPAEAARIGRALENSRAFTRALPALEALPGSDGLIPFDMVVANVSAQEPAYPWTQFDLLVKNDKPLLFIGSREMLLELPPGVQEQAQDFLVAPWDPDEVVLRACRVLSRAAKDLRPPSQPSPPPAAAGTAAGSSQVQRVLLADDDPTITALISASLRKFGIECDIAHDGAEAIEMTRKLVPGVLILDVLMPQFDGFEVLATLKRERQTSAVRIIMLSVRQQPADIMRAFSFGADDYVIKPFNPLELAARIKRLLPVTRETASQVA